MMPSPIQSIQTRNLKSNSQKNKKKKLKKKAKQQYLYEAIEKAQKEMESLSQEYLLCFGDPHQEKLLMADFSQIF